MEIKSIKAEGWWVVVLRKGWVYAAKRAIKEINEIK